MTRLFCHDVMQDGYYGVPVWELESDHLPLEFPVLNDTNVCLTNMHFSVVSI